MIHALKYCYRVGRDEEQDSTAGPNFASPASFVSRWESCWGVPSPYPAKNGGEILLNGKNVQHTETKKRRQDEIRRCRAPRIGLAGGTIRHKPIGIFAPDDFRSFPSDDPGHLSRRRDPRRHRKTDNGHGSDREQPEPDCPPPQHL